MAEKNGTKELWRFKNDRPPIGREAHAGRIFEVRSTLIGLLGYYLDKEGAQKIFGVRSEDIERVPEK